MKIATYCGGIAATNAYYLPEARALIDAPEGADKWLRDNDWSPDLLLLTHGHFDHVWDAAAIKNRTGCRVAYHPDDRPLVMDLGAQARMFGLELDSPGLDADIALKDGGTVEAGAFAFRTLHVPGHCPGSICFYCEAEGLIFGGDVLFASGIGRTDLPGGSTDTLLSGIRKKLLTLPDTTCLYPGHGPPTRIGREKQTNPFLAE